MKSEARMWTLKRFAPSIGGGRETRVTGATLEDGEEVDAIEVGPVLDLLKALRGDDELAAAYALSDIDVLLGRLSEEEGRTV